MKLMCSDSQWDEIRLFNIGKWVAVLHFSLVRLPPVAYLGCYMVFMGNQSLYVIFFCQYTA